MVRVAHSVIVCPVVPQAVLTVNCGPCLQVKFRRTHVAESCQVDVVSVDVWYLVAQLWGSSLGSVIAVGTFVPSLHLAYSAQTFVSAINISSFLVVGLHIFSEVGVELIFY